MNSADNIEHTIEQLHITTRPETDKRILDDAFVALEKSAQEQSFHVARSTRPNILRIRIAEFAAVAAVILVVFALFFGTPAKAVTFGQVIQAVGKVKNICVSRFSADKAEPYQRVWTSQTMNIRLFEGVEEGQMQYVLYDLPNRVRKTKFLFSDLIRIDDISADMFAQIKKTLTSTVGLIPFTDINRVPKDSQWNHVEDPNVSAIVPDTEIYDLTYPQKSTTGTGIRFIKNRLFVDPFTKLPKRIEFYTKLTLEEKYRFRNFSVITYPDESQIRTFIRETYGADALQPRDPGYRGTPQPN